MDESGTMRVTVEEAARLLGIEKGSVKKRVQRNKLRWERDASGTLYVYLDESETVQDRSQGQSETSRDELLASKDETISILRDQLREERETRRRADTLLAQAMQSNTALNERLRELEAPSDAPAPSQGREAAAESAAEDEVGVRTGQGDTDAPTAPAKSSTRTVAENVSTTVISAAIIGAAVVVGKVLIPAIAAIAAFVVAGVTASNGDNTVSAISAAIGIVTAAVSALQAFIALRRSRLDLPFEYHFSESSWTKRGDSEFTLEIPKSEHGKGDSPTTNVYMPTADGGYSEVIPGLETRPSGAVLISVSKPAAGKVVIR